ncbi:efflux RND transporter periplasmic adaptor subunit [Phenylobacterium deserti]|uniref:Efflux transporter periplasmic adaptor subunit n=1 Tax=Phenylobacterium deserti TaxID=1914756 RepID=A0A328AE22_9CAUL|nr:efflux RND transporter periplasmic adaptor subunit [Phenylobacterium deserti]RAK52737.1 efflux transporter periplasmic adaptor subunit [Phenylobacterium deserti]
MSDVFPSRALALVAALFLASCGVDAQTAAPAPPPPVVEVAPVAFESLPQWSDFTGRLEALDAVSLHPRVSGEIVSAAFQEGARVRKGQLLFQIDPRPFQAEVDRQRAAVERAAATAQLARADQVRAERLMAQDAIARDQAERLTAQARAAQADLQAARAALRAAELNLAFTRVVSPIDGRVSRALITRGNLVTPSDLLTTIVSDGPIYAAFNTDEQTYLKYAAAQRGDASPVLMGLMTEEGFPHRGRLQFIDNAVDARSGTIVARAVFDNRDAAFTPGLFARVRLVSGAPQPVALVPELALGTDLGKRFVLVVGPGDKVQYRAVTLGPAVGDWRVITAGLKPGDRVVTAGLQKVKPGDAVRPKAASLAPRTAAVDSLRAAAG